MADYQIVSRGNTARALIDWEGAPRLLASVSRPQQTTTLTESTVQVVTGVEQAGLLSMLNQWVPSNPFPLILMAGGSAQAFFNMDPAWPVEIRVTSGQNSLVMHDWASALQLGGWNLLNSAQTRVKIDAQP